MSFGIASLGLFLENFGLNRRDSESETPDEVDVESGLGAPLYDRGPQTRIRRAPVRGMATLSWEAGPDRVYGGIENVSPSGCLIKTEATIDEGTQIEFRLAAVGGDREIEVEGVGMVRHTTDVDGRRAYGIEFLEIDDDDALHKLYNMAAA